MTGKYERLKVPLGNTIDLGNGAISFSHRFTITSMKPRKSQKGAILTGRMSQLKVPLGSTTDINK